MHAEPLLLSLTGLMFTRAGDPQRGRFRVSVKMIVKGFTGAADDKFDLDEVADLIRAQSEKPAMPIEIMAKEIRDEVLAMTGVASAMVCVSDLHAFDDADAKSACTLPDPKHAVLYGLSS